jgi:hypothetical protein
MTYEREIRKSEKDRIRGLGLVCFVNFPETMNSHRTAVLSAHEKRYFYGNANVTSRILIIGSRVGRDQTYAGRTASKHLPKQGT